MKPWTSPTPRPYSSEGKEFFPVMQETLEMWVQSQGGEDPLEEGTATHSSILAWKIPSTKEPGRAIVQKVAKSQTPLSTHAVKPQL